MESESANPIKVKCDCGSSLKVPASVKRNQRQSVADAKETRRVASGLAKAFLQSLLVPINALFLFLPVGSAFRIAARGFGGD